MGSLTLSDGAGTAGVPKIICYRRQFGKHKLAGSFTPSDPKPTIVLFVAYSGHRWEADVCSITLSLKEALVLLPGSRYCEGDRLSETAWSRFGKTLLGCGGVLAIGDYVHQHIAFGHGTRTRQQDGTGSLLRWHRRLPLAVALCRCMTMPARYCTG
jgi:hypothetical protein